MFNDVTGTITLSILNSDDKCDDDKRVNVIDNDGNDDDDDNDDKRVNDPDNGDNDDDNDKRVNDPDDTLNGGIHDFLLHFYLSPGPPPATWEPRGHGDDADDDGDDADDGDSDDDGRHPAKPSLCGYHFTDFSKLTRRHIGLIP